MLHQIWLWLVSWFRPPNPFRSEGFLETQKWALDYNPSRGEEDYTLALEYGQSRYEEMISVSEAIDKKLDDIARTSLAIGVIIATVARALGSGTPLGRSPLLILAVLGFAWSVWIAVLSRNPTSFATPLEVRSLLQVMEDHAELTPNKIKALIASSYHVAMVGTYATNAWKAKQLWRASVFLIAGISLLILMLFTSSPSSSPPSTGLQVQSKSQTDAV